MTLRKATITNLLSDFQQELAKPNVLFVVLGDSKDSEKLVQDADDLAGEEHNPRRVIWAKKPEIIKDEVGKITCKDCLYPQLDLPDRGFTISTLPNREICDVIAASEQKPDNTRIVGAYFKAEE
jgi:hypothetical protein